MYGLNDSNIRVSVSSEFEMERANQNLSLLVNEFEENVLRKNNTEQEEIEMEVWIGVILTLMVVLCACSMCGFLIYNRIQVMKHRARQNQDVENTRSAAGRPYSDPLPSYTVVSGLPSYKEALEQLKTMKSIQNDQLQTDEKERAHCAPQVPPTPVETLSVKELFKKCKSDD